MQKTFWDGLKQQYQFHSTPTLELIAGFIIANKCKRVFEASCGTGYFIKILRDAGYGDKFLGTDYCDCFIESASQNNPKDVFAKIDLSEKIPLKDNKFDACVVHHGIDYVYPYRNAFKELKRLSSKFVIITLWQKFSDENSIRFNKECGWNVNIYKADEWYQALKEAGYKIIVDAEVDEWNDAYGKNVYNHLFILQKI